MKYLIRKSKKDGSFIDMMSVNEEYIHEYRDVKELEEKQGFYITYQYNKDTDKIEGKYIEIPKSQAQINYDEIMKLKRAIVTKNQMPDLNELKDVKNVSEGNKIGKEELSELHNLV